MYRKKPASDIGSHDGLANFMAVSIFLPDPPGGFNIQYWKAKATIKEATTIRELRCFSSQSRCLFLFFLMSLDGNTLNCSSINFIWLSLMLSLCFA